ncbi:MAG: arginine--tRNA ligase [Desulfovibrio sp.]|nr:arginine--tRNA ligase [Desulfovibrio sp.]
MQAKEILLTAFEQAFSDLGLEKPEKITFERPKQPKFGDLSTNVAMLIAKQAGRPARELAASLAQELPRKCPEIARVEVAGPGFCNITFKPAFWQRVLPLIEETGPAYGNGTSGQGKTALVEYVSANPTGPLHVGHGRGAALGDSVARILRAAGYGVDTEYYLNDAGRQMKILGRSVWLRARELAGQKTDFPEDHYQGGYIIDLAREALNAHPGLPDLDEDAGVELCRQFGMEKILADIKGDMLLFRCEHNKFASEKAYLQNGAVARALEQLEKDGHSYHSDGALWLRTESEGDDHDRVLRKRDGSLTYLATDIAYHNEKYERGYDLLVDVWGADHHGYIPRMRAAIRDMGRDPDRFVVLLVQLVNLIRDGKPVQMSTRSGEFYPLRELIDEVGTDAARFTFLSRSNDSPLDFDVDLAKKRSLDNPVYYVQYAHARICALLRRAAEKGIRLPEKTGSATLTGLDSLQELALMRQLSAFPEIVTEAAARLAPYLVSKYLIDLAGEIHGYYAHRQIIDPDDEAGSLARLVLLRACGQTLKNGLFLLGVSAPELM